MSITLEEAKKMLRISKHRLDDELEVQSQVQFDIAESMATANARQLALKSDLAKSDAELLIDLRKGLKKTVTELDAEIQIDSEHIILLRQFQTALKEYELWNGMYESWKARGFALRGLSDLSMSNYFVVDTTYDNNRKIIAESRTSGASTPRRVRR